MEEVFWLGCPCGKKIKIIKDNITNEYIKCPDCKRYIKIPINLLKEEKYIDTSFNKEKLIGKILSKRYKIEEHIADGAMGHVFKALDMLLNTYVAIKILKPVFYISERLKQRFINEAKIGAQLNHPNIISVRNFYRTKKGKYFIVMDYCEGESLKDILEEKKKLSIEESLDIIIQILKGLSYAHKKGIIHRDIKPSNIMIEKKEKIIKILDFGIAKVIFDSEELKSQTITLPGYIVGTTRFMAPEQVLKKKLTFSTDIYGVGVLFYYMVSGVYPFDGNTKEEILKKILKIKPVSLRKIYKKHYPQEKFPFLLDIIIHISLIKSQKNRYKNAEEFIEVLNFLKKKGNKCKIKIIKLIIKYYINYYFEIIIGLIFSSIIFLIILSIFITHKNLIISNSKNFNNNILKTFFQEEKKIKKIEKLIKEEDYNKALKEIEQYKTNKNFIFIEKIEKKWIKYFLNNNN